MDDILSLYTQLRDIVGGEGIGAVLTALLSILLYYWRKTGLLRAADKTYKEALAQHTAQWQENLNAVKAAADARIAEAVRLVQPLLDQTKALADRLALLTSANNADAWNTATNAFAKSVATQKPVTPPAEVEVPPPASEPLHWMDGGIG